MTMLISWILTAIVLLLGYRLILDQRRKQDDTDSIPYAPNALPILGHALWYKKDPPGFLIQTYKLLGPIFRLNLAGKHMIVVCDQTVQKPLANLPESVLSAKQATADIGFAQTLGSLNVYEGTSLHKGILKGFMNQKDNNCNDEHPTKVWIRALRKAMAYEMKESKTRQRRKQHESIQVEFLTWMRRCMLRTTINVMIGSAFLSNCRDDTFVQQFMDFQDSLEDVTAQAVILPKPLALLLFLWPMQRRREIFQFSIQQRLDEILSLTSSSDKKDPNDDSLGFWLEAVKDSYTTAQIAEFVVGLLFAAHKNPAIGAAQSFLLLQEQGSKELRQLCYQEAPLFLSYFSSKSEPNTPALRKVCLETLRITAHSIGAIRTAQQEVTIDVTKTESNANNTTVTTTYTIPKGSTVSFSHIVPNLMDPIWKNTGPAFDSSTNDAKAYENEYTFTTFSHGVHACPGQSLALLLSQASIAILLVDYIVTIPITLPSLSFERATLAQRKGPVTVQIATR